MFVSMFLRWNFLAPVFWWEFLFYTKSGSLTGAVGPSVCAWWSGSCTHRDCGRPRGSDRISEGLGISGGLSMALAAAAPSSLQAGGARTPPLAPLGPHPHSILFLGRGTVSPRSL